MNLSYTFCYTLISQPTFLVMFWNVLSMKKMSSQENNWLILFIEHLSKYTLNKFPVYILTLYESFKIIPLQVYTLMQTSILLLLFLDGVMWPPSISLLLAESSSRTPRVEHINWIYTKEKSAESSYVFH